MTCLQDLATCHHKWDQALSKDAAGRVSAELKSAVQEHQIAAHEQLYQDAIRRRLRQEEMAHWFPEDVTFQPTLETGGHHPDTAKVIADPNVRVSDRWV